MGSSSTGPPAPREMLHHIQLGGGTGVLGARRHGAHFFGASAPLSRHLRANFAASRRKSPAAALLASRQQESVRLPLDFYKLLQVTPTTSRESTSRAYER